MRITGATPIAQLAERRERSPRVAIFDGFAEKGGEPDHGDAVEDVILRSGGLTDRQVQNYQNSFETATSLEDVQKASAKDLLAKLESYTAETTVGFLEATRLNLRDVMDRPNTKVRVINQSQSICAARVARPFIADLLGDNEDFRVIAKEALGLPLRAHKKTVAEAFLKAVQGMFDNNKDIASATKDYRAVAKEAYDRGISHVVTAGNLGSVAAHYEDVGMKIPPNAFRSVLATEFATIVGATDSRGTTTLRDDRAANFTSVYAGTEFSMHGINVGTPAKDWVSERYSNGTSFAAPQMTALIHGMVTTNPSLSVDQVEGLLYRSTVPVKGTEEQLGAGQVDPHRAP